MLVAIVAVISIGVWVSRERGQDGSTGGSQCARACVMGCNRDLECGGSPIDCADACRKQCAGAKDRVFDTKECLARIKGLSCEDAARLAMGDSSMLSGACGVP